jgi:hypothetical protein
MNIPMHWPKKGAKILQTQTKETWRRKWSTRQTGQEKRQLQNSDYVSGMTAWVHISTASESAPNLSVCYAASANPWTETIWDIMPHWPKGQSVSDTGRLGQK